MIDRSEESRPVNPHCGDYDSAGLLAHARRLEALVIRLHDAAREAEAGHAQRRAALEDWVSRTEARLAEVEAENARLRVTIAELHASTSWRVTAPLRWFRQRLY